MRELPRAPMGVSSHGGNENKGIFKSLSIHGTYSQISVVLELTIQPFIQPLRITVCGHRMAQRKWKETKHQTGTAGPGTIFGCYLVSIHFLWAILWPHPVH